MNALAALAASVALVVLPAGSTAWLPASLRAAFVAAGLLLLPGYLVVAACGLQHRVPLGGRPALYFAASLGAIVPASVAVVALHASLVTLVPLLAATLVIPALVAARSRTRHAAARTPGATKPMADDDRLPAAAVAALAVAVTAGAWLFTATGSIDRWWYLGYVRGWIEADSVGLAEPFLGSGFVHPRFTFNPWLLAVAVWAKQSATDPVWLYERACPVLLVPLAFSAALFLARSLFRSTYAAWSATLAAALLWTGGTLFPMLARAPEDKLLALVVLAPVTAGLCVRALATPHAPWTVLAAVAIAAQSTTHILVYALLLIVLGPFTVLMLARHQVRPVPAAILLAVLLTGALYPAANGLQVRAVMQAAAGSTDADGADAAVAIGTAYGSAGTVDARAGDADATGSATGNHPVARVHRAQERLLRLDDYGAPQGWYTVHPRLLLHPLMIVALASIALAWRRPDRERLFILPATLIPLALGFVPPLPVAVGSLVLPWMVHRLLWIVPFGLLLGVAADEARARMPRARWMPVAVLVLLAVPGALRAVAERTEARRTRLATPRTGPAHRLLDAMAALPDDSVIAAAHGLSERIPGTTGKRVLAMGDRATIVFAGSRAAGEARLRSRAAIFAGVWKPSDAPVPTHVVLAPRARAERYCVQPLFEAGGYELCAFSPAPPLPGVRLWEAPAGQRGSIAISALGGSDGDDARPQRRSDISSPAAADASAGAASRPLAATCQPPPKRTGPHWRWPRPGPWSAQYVTAECTVTAGGAGASIADVGLQARSLHVTADVGAAAEELLIMVTAERNGRQRWSLRTRERVEGKRALEYRLPQGPVDRIAVTIAPSFLPSLRLAALRLTFDPREPNEPGAPHDAREPDKSRAVRERRAPHHGSPR